jgi:hypothetical protein
MGAIPEGNWTSMPWGGSVTTESIEVTEERPALIPFLFYLCELCVLCGRMFFFD